MIQTQTTDPQIIGNEDYRELTPGVYQNAVGDVVITDGTEAPLKITVNPGPDFLLLPQLLS